VQFRRPIATKDQPVLVYQGCQDRRHYQHRMRAKNRNEDVLIKTPMMTLRERRRPAFAIGQ